MGIVATVVDAQLSRGEIVTLTTVTSNTQIGSSVASPAVVRHFLSTADIIPDITTILLIPSRCVTRDENTFVHLIEGAIT